MLEVSAGFKNPRNVVVVALICVAPILKGVVHDLAEEEVLEVELDTLDTTEEMIADEVGCALMIVLLVDEDCTTTRSLDDEENIDVELLAVMLLLGSEDEGLTALISVLDVKVLVVMRLLDFKKVGDVTLTGVLDERGVLVVEGTKVWLDMTDEDVDGEA